MSLSEAFSGCFPLESHAFLMHCNISGLRRTSACVRSAIHFGALLIGFSLYLFAGGLFVFFHPQSITPPPAPLRERVNLFSFGRIIPLVYTILMEMPLDMSCLPPAQGGCRNHHGQLDSNGMFSGYLSRRGFTAENCTCRNDWQYKTGLQIEWLPSESRGMRKSGCRLLAPGTSQLSRDLGIRSHC